MKPILFNTDMVHAILGDRKMVTRRVVKAQEPDWKFLSLENDPYMTRINRNGEEYPSQETGLWAVFEWGAEFQLVKAPYRPGDILYVRETWGDYSECQPGGAGYYLYRADYPDGAKTYDADGHICDMPRWRPSIHMPREAARIFLRVTDVRVERLQDMQPYDIAFEGFRRQRDFIALWNSTIKPTDRALYGWEANPWVWVIEFERCEKPTGD